LFAEAVPVPPLAARVWEQERDSRRARQQLLLLQQTGHGDQPDVPGLARCSNGATRLRDDDSRTGLGPGER
jgi:hypothetical protein